MKLKKETLAAVVAEASKQMSDPNYSAVMVGGFVENQAPTTQFIGSHGDDLGGAEGIVSVIFHCALIALAFERDAGTAPAELSFDDLDAVAKGRPLVTLEGRQPAIHEFITSNLERSEAQHLVALVALAMERAAG
ncbi:MAG: hypothetical protein R2939_04325 [Kofleriaceae bacterium]